MSLAWVCGWILTGDQHPPGCFINTLSALCVLTARCWAALGEKNSAEQPRISLVWCCYFKTSQNARQKKMLLSLGVEGIFNVSLNLTFQTVVF